MATNILPGQALIESLGIPYSLTTKEGSTFLLEGVQITVQSGDHVVIDAKYTGIEAISEEFTTILKRFELKEKE